MFQVATLSSARGGAREFKVRFSARSVLAGNPGVLAGNTQTSDLSVLPPVLQFAVAARVDAPAGERTPFRLTNLVGECSLAGSNHALSESPSLQSLALTRNAGRSHSSPPD